MPKTHFAISEKLNLPKLFASCIPAIMMMISISIYSVVDGFFVSNFVGKAEFASVNLMFPIVMILASIGFVMGTGGSALVSTRFGEGKPEEANRLFSNCISIGTAFAIVASLAVVFFVPQIAKGLGADEEMLPHCITYATVLVAGTALYGLQNLFQPFFSASGKPQLGFFVTIAAGVTNMILDAVLICWVKIGILGAAIGTVSGWAVGGIIPIIYFLSKNKSTLRLHWNHLNWRAIGKMASNGVGVKAVSMEEKNPNPAQPGREFALGLFGMFPDAKLLVILAEGDGLPPVLASPYENWVVMDAGWVKRGGGDAAVVNDRMGKRVYQALGACCGAAYHPEREAVMRYSSTPESLDECLSHNFHPLNSNAFSIVARAVGLDPVRLRPRKELVEMGILQPRPAKTQDTPIPQDQPAESR